MTVERLISALWTEAELKERALMDEARERAAQITAEREETLSRLNERIEIRKKQIEADSAALASSMERMRKRRSVLLAMAKATDMARRETEKYFRDFMRSENYAQYLSREIDSITKESGAIAEIRADELTAESLRKIGIPNVVADPAVENGFVVVVGGGESRVFCLFSTKFEKLWRAEAPSFVAKISEAMPHGD